MSKSLLSIGSGLEAKSQGSRGLRPNPSPGGPQSAARKKAK
jgi:hypothetical protein